MGKHLLTPLGAEAIQPLAAQLQQLVAFAVAQLVAADQGGGTVAIAGDAVEGEPCPPCASQDPPGHVLCRGGGMGESWLW